MLIYVAVLFFILYDILCFWTETIQYIFLYFIPFYLQLIYKREVNIIWKKFHGSPFLYIYFIFYYANCVYTKKQQY